MRCEKYEDARTPGSFRKFKNTLLHFDYIDRYKFRNRETGPREAYNLGQQEKWSQNVLSCTEQSNVIQSVMYSGDMPDIICLGGSSISQISIRLREQEIFNDNKIATIVIRQE